MFKKNFKELRNGFTSLLPLKNIKEWREINCVTILNTESSSTVKTEDQPLYLATWDWTMICNFEKKKIRGVVGQKQENGKK